MSIVRNILSSDVAGHFQVFINKKNINKNYALNQKLQVICGKSQKIHRQTFDQGVTIDPRLSQCIDNRPILLDTRCPEKK